MPDRDGAQIIVGASPVAAGRRHTYLLFEYSDGRQIVVRGGPDARSEGNDIANLAGSTLLGSDNFGKIRVHAAPYVAPYEAADRMHADGSREPIPAAQVQAGTRRSSEMRTASRLRILSTHLIGPRRENTTNGQRSGRAATRIWKRSLPLR